ncbi:D-alanine--D-alanine ligase [uncultured Candidatus Thioglobus sp.]|nr:D-alanine--D-alanine ligase [uncultured Candidatus Thioglobus sp.]
MAKIKVGVLSGGISLEREVSRLSAENVLQHLDAEKYDIFDIIVNKKAQFFCDNKEIKYLDLGKKIDIVLSVLHGTWGEDGQIQTILDKNNIPYIGSNALGSKQSFSKITTKKILTQNGINTPDYLILNNHHKHKVTLKTVTTKFPQGCVIKIDNSGSSLGIFVCHNEPQILNALAEIERNFSAKDTFFAEQYISGKEYTCGVIDNDAKAEALPIIELVMSKSANFFNFDAKYTGESTKICPAKIKPHLTQNIQKTALNTHKALKLTDFSRTDFIHSNHNELFVLEINSIPCMAKTSLFYQALSVKGIVFSDFLNHLIAKKVS